MAIETMDWYEESLKKNLKPIYIAYSRVLKGTAVLNRKEMLKTMI